MSGRHLGIAAASACTAMLVLPGIGATILAAPAASTAPAVRIMAQQEDLQHPGDAPYLVQCLDGSTGAAIWSNNMTGVSDWCRTGYNASPRVPGGGNAPGPSLSLGPNAVV